MSCFVFVGNRSRAERHAPAAYRHKNTYIYKYNTIPPLICQYFFSFSFRFLSFFSRLFQPFSSLFSVFWKYSNSFSKLWKGRPKKGAGDCARDAAASLPLDRGKKEPFLRYVPQKRLSLGGYNPPPSLIPRSPRPRRSPDNRPLPRCSQTFHRKRGIRDFRDPAPGRSKRSRRRRGKRFRKIRRPRRS